MVLRAEETRRVTIPRYLQVELAAQASELGISTAAYTARLLEEGAGMRDMPIAWRHIAQARRKVNGLPALHSAAPEGGE